jgi:glycosyltransferase involved in cell wall biosynthesis
MISKPISLMLFTNATARGGAEEHMLTLLHGLSRSHFRLYLVCPGEVAEKLEKDLPPDVELIPLSLQNPKQLNVARRFAQILRDRQVQILHSHRFYSSLFASPIAAFCRVPVIIETPHLSERWRQGWCTSHFVVDRLVGRFVDYYIAVSQANACYLAKEKGLPVKKIVVIRNGCDIQRFEHIQQPAAGLKTSISFSEEDRVVVIAARLEPQKGHAVLLRALPRILREFSEVRLVCLGDGCLRSELGSLAESLGLRHAVRFVGHQSNVGDWLAMAEFSVLPSLWEGLPLIAIESLAAGRAVVATGVDGTPEVVVHGKTGLIVPPNDSESLANAICCLLRDPALSAKMGRAGREWVSEQFTQERQIRQTEEVYLRALEERSGPQPAANLPRIVSGYAPR